MPSKRGHFYFRKICRPKDLVGLSSMKQLVLNGNYVATQVLSLLLQIQV